MLLWVIGMFISVARLAVMAWLTIVSCVVNLESASIFPLEVMLSIFRYGYAALLYNPSRALRTIVFGTKNHGTFTLFLTSCVET